MEDEKRSVNCQDRMFSPGCNTLIPVKTIHENPWFSLKCRGGYYTIEYHYHQVVVLPVVDEHSIVMVRVKRPVIADTPLELPAGGSNPDETPLDAITRELGEETGIIIKDHKRFRLLPSIAISPNRYPILPWIYKINISEKEFLERKKHDTEIASVELFSFDEVCQMIRAGLIYVSLPLAIISRFLLDKKLN